VRSAAAGSQSLDFEFLGERKVKNIAKAVRAYRVVVVDETAQAPLPCPYPGMVPFGAANAQHFCGRTEEIKRMVQLLRHQRFMMVIGPSGSGKSSLVYAGLLPELKKSKYFAKDYWLIRTMRPGSQPTKVLTDLIGAGEETGDFEPGTVDGLLKAHAPAERLLLLVDQFEELFTQADRDEQARFIAALQAFRVPENCALILTLRADFYPDLMTSYLWPVDASQRVEVAPLRGEALREAIERPAADVGVRIEDSLVNQLLADAADEPGALPLLQETMGLLWDDMEQRTLPFSAYERLSRGAHNGLAVAIAMKADATLAELSQNQKAIARRIFLRLIQFGEGRADTRRQQPVASLRAANDEPDEFEKTLDHLTDHRLLTRSGGDDNTPPSVDISHEALIDGWSRLQDWADERREAEQIRRRLEGKAAEWLRLGKGTGGLLDEAELPEAERWLASDDADDLGIDAALPELVDMSQRAIAEAEQEKESARQKELAQAQALAEEQSRAAGRMRRSMMGLAAVLLVAVGAGLFAWTQSQKAQSLAVQEAAARQQAEARGTEAEARRVEAENARLASVAQLLLIQAPQQQATLLDERAVLMARQAHLYSSSGSRQLKLEVDSVLRTVVGKPYFSPMLGPQTTYPIAFSPDGTQLATAHLGPSEIRIWNPTQPGAKPVVLPGYHGKDSYNYALEFSPDGKTLVAADTAGFIGKWDTGNLQVPVAKLPPQDGGVWSIAFSPDGRWMVTGSKQTDAFAVWDLTGTAARPTMINDPQLAPADSAPPKQREGGVPVAFNPDGTMLATGSLSGVIRFWRTGDFSAPVASLNGHKGSLLALSFSGDGKYLASSGQDATVRLWSLKVPTSAPLLLKTGTKPVNSLDFSSDGTRLVSSSLGDGIRLWQVSEPEAPPVVIPAGFIRKVLFSPDDKHLASGGIDNGLRLWELEPSGQPKVLEGQGALAFAFSPDMKLMASGGRTGDNTIKLWNWDDLGAPPMILPGQGGAINGLDFSADGKRLASASWNGKGLLVWDLEQSPPVFSEAAGANRLAPWMTRFSPDGLSVVASGDKGAFSRNLADLKADPKNIFPIKYWATGFDTSPNGDAIVMGAWGPEIYLKDLKQPDKPASKLLGHAGPKAIWSVVFSPDGKQIASSGRLDSTVRLWDADDPGAPSKVLGRHDAAVKNVRFSPDGRQLASVSMDHSVRLWDVNNPDALPIVLHRHDEPVEAVEYSPDGKHLLVGAVKTFMIWDLTHPRNSSTTQEIADKVCQKTWRNLTLEEWHKFVGVELPYERTCPNLPIHPSLFKAAARLAKAKDIEGAVVLLERAVELDSTLDLNPKDEAERLAKPATE
jgi:WD40 repeat protein